MKHKLVFIVNLFIMTILIVIFSVVPKGANEILIWFCLGVFYLHFFSSVRKPLIIAGGITTFIKIDTFFMLFFYIIYYYPYQLAVLGLKNLNTAFFLDRTFAEYSNAAISMATVGLIAFQLGFSYYKNKNKNVVNYRVSKKYMKVLTFIILFFIGLILGLFAITGMETLFVGSYVGSKTGDITYDAIFTLVTYFIVLGGVQVITYYKIFKKLQLTHLIILFIVSVWSILLLIIGDRNTFFIVGIVFFAGLFTYVWKISRKLILVFLFGALTLYQVIEISRRAETRSIEAIWDALVNIDSYTSDQKFEIGSFDITTIGNRVTYKLIPQEQDFFYGKFKLVSLTSLIPYSSRLFLEKDDKITGSSNVLKNEMIGQFATWGVGTNIITDCYMDFGILGVVLIMFLLGKFGGYVKRNTQVHVNSPKWMFLYLITLGYFSEIARYGVDFPLRSIVWTFLLFIFVDKMLKLSKLNRVI